MNAAAAIEDRDRETAANLSAVSDAIAEANRVVAELLAATEQKRKERLGG